MALKPLISKFSLTLPRLSIPWLPLLVSLTLLGACGIAMPRLVAPFNQREVNGALQATIRLLQEERALHIEAVRSSLACRIELNRRLLHRPDQRAPAVPPIVRERKSEKRL